MRKLLLASTAAAALTLGFAGTADAFFAFESADLPAFTGTGSVPVAGNTVLVSNVLAPPWVGNDVAGAGGSPLGTSKWISYNANTGPAAPTTVAANGSTMTVTINLPSDANSLKFNIWADDTAQVVLDGVTLVSFNGFTDGICAAGSIGCQPGEWYAYDMALTPGTAKALTFTVRQDNANAFGLNYKGEYGVVPIPAALPLMLTALAGLGLVARRRSGDSA